MKRIALFFDRPYIDAHACFTELCRQLLKSNYIVDLYYLQNPYNPPPIFFDDRIRVLPFPLSKIQKAEFWFKIYFSIDRKYCAAFGTPIFGATLAESVARVQKIPYFYFADEIFDPVVGYHQVKNWKLSKKKDIHSNQNAIATIALGEERFRYQKRINFLADNHTYFILPNSQSGEAFRLKSNYFRDVLNITDNYPIVLFIGTIEWRLCKIVLEQTAHYTRKDYHIVFHGRSIGSLGKFQEHPFIHFSTSPLPSYLLNYAVSSSDAGLVLYDKNSPHERENAPTAGKISTYLKNGLPIIAGNLEQFKEFELENIGVFWDGQKNIDIAIQKLLRKRNEMSMNIPEYYRKNLNYEHFFIDFEKFLKLKIK